MYSARDFEKLWFLYKTEDELNDIPLSFFMIHGVSHTHFYDSYNKIIYL